MRALIPPPPLPTNVNLKPNYYTSPITKRFSKKLTLTSTPQRLWCGANLSSIHYVETNNSTTNVPNQDSFHITKNDTNKPKRSESFKQPAFVATRARRPQPVAGKHLAFEQSQAKETDDEIVDDAAMVSSVNISAMDISSIMEVNEDNEESDGESMAASNDSFEITKNKTNSSVPESSKQTEDKHESSIEDNKDDSFDLAQPKPIDTNDSSIWLDQSVNKPTMQVSVQVHQCDVSTEVISVSSTSTTTSVTNSIVNQPKLSDKPRVGFDTTTSIHELSVASRQNEPSQKLVMKSGKWRRTVFEARRNKTSQCKFLRDICIYS